MYLEAGQAEFYFPRSCFSDWWSFLNSQPVMRGSPWSVSPWYESVARFCNCVTAILSLREQFSCPRKNVSACAISLIRNQSSDKWAENEQQVVLFAPTGFFQRRFLHLLNYEWKQIPGVSTSPISFSHPCYQGIKVFWLAPPWRLGRETTDLPSFSLDFQSAAIETLVSLELPCNLMEIMFFCKSFQMSAWRGGEERLKPE